MTFIKYTNDGKAVIQPAALTLSGLEQEETLEMHILEKPLSCSNRIWSRWRKPPL